MTRSEQLGRADDWWTSINNQPEGIKVPGVYRKDTVFSSFDCDIREDEAKQRKKEEQAAAHPSVRAPVSVCTRGLEVKNNESP